MYSVLLLIVCCASAVQLKESVLKEAIEHGDVVSGEDHYADGEGHEHNAEYDHEAFLGKDQAEVYNHLSPDEAKQRLGELFPKVDANSDGQVTADELKKWMAESQNRFATADAADNIKSYDVNGDGNVEWDEFKTSAYGFLNKDGVPADEIDTEKYPRYNKDKNDKEYYAKEIARDERRFAAADTDGDKKLKFDEFVGMLHPETFPHTRGLTAAETLEDMDKDKDGFVSMEEYISDIAPGGEDAAKEANGGEIPEWLTDEKKNFTAIHDTNKDGKLDEKEIKEWIFPSDADYLEQEAQHLVQEADENKDGKISKEEMLDKHDVFVGSQATDYGEALREEL